MHAWNGKFYNITDFESGGNEIGGNGMFYTGNKLIVNNARIVYGDGCVDLGGYAMNINPGGINVMLFDAINSGYGNDIDLYVYDGVAIDNSYHGNGGFGGYHADRLWVGSETNGAYEYGGWNAYWHQTYSPEGLGPSSTHLFVTDSATAEHTTQSHPPPTPPPTPSPPLAPPPKPPLHPSLLSLTDSATAKHLDDDISNLPYGHDADVLKNVKGRPVLYLMWAVESGGQTTTAQFEEIVVAAVDALGFATPTSAPTHIQNDYYYYDTPSLTPSPTPVPTPVPTPAPTPSPTPSLDGLDKKERHIEVNDEKIDRHECRDWCSSKKHILKAWKDKCKWYACSDCPECVLLE